MAEHKARSYGLGELSQKDPLCSRHGPGKRKMGRLQHHIGPGDVVNGKLSVMIRRQSTATQFAGVLCLQDDVAGDASPCWGGGVSYVATDNQKPAASRGQCTF